MPIRGAKRIACLAGSFLVLLGALAGPASASFHLIRIREVYPGSLAAPSSDYVVLQFTASGQNQVKTHPITLYNAAGALSATVPMGAKVDGTGDQSTILLAGSGYAAAFPGSPAADFSSSSLDAISPAGGAVCYPDGSPADCVSWGSFTPSASGYPSASTPNASPVGVTDGKALIRSIAPGCPTLLESGDDTDSSAADFSESTPNPRPNSTAPTERPCPTPGTTIKSGPRGRTRDRTPTFGFKSSLAGAGFRCKLDRGRFRPCTSPKTLGSLGLGPHTFRVKAVAAGRTDPTPARRGFRVVKPH